MSRPQQHPSRPSAASSPEPAPAIRTKPAHKGLLARVSDSLRVRVVELLSHSHDQLARLPVTDIRSLVQELDTHQVELEQQNEELRLAQLALAESRDRLSDLYEFAPVGYLTLDATAVVRQCNLAAAELLGLPREKLLGRHFAHFVGHQDGDAFHLYFQQALLGEHKTSSEFAMHKADRSRSPLRLRLESTRIRAADPAPGGPGACHVALIDLTQHALDQARLSEMNRGLERAVVERTAELSESLARLRANEERLALALEVGGMGTWTLDLERRRAFCDERHERLCGRQPHPDGHPLEVWRNSLHPEDRERMEALMRRAAQGLDAALAAEYRIVWADGSVHWLAVRGRVIFDKDRKPTHIVGVEQDIDERKSLEMEVLHIADAEQRRIGQELHDDIQQRLIGLGLIAESLCEGLMQKSAPEQTLCARLTQEIGETSVRVNRLSHGLVPLELEGDGLVVALHRLARATEVPGRLRCGFEQDEALEVRDGFAATHLYRIAQEAVTNAIRHSGASRISIGLTRNAGRAVLTVADDGCGIQPRGGDGRGLRIMAYRASLIGAVLKVERKKTRGTRMTCAFAIAGGGGVNDDPRA